MLTERKNKRRYVIVNKRERKWGEELVTNKKREKDK
jgi:hypothetical protein